MGLKMIVGLIGGLGLFLFGMKNMAEGLQKAAGDRLRRILELFTTRPITAVLTGAAATVLLQSSATTTVMVVGFVNSGLMNIYQAVSTIMGANIGTTITAQIVSFNIFALALPFSALGAFLNFFSKKSLRRHLGTGFLGFGLLLLGLSTMSSAVDPLRESRFFLETLVAFGQKPLLGILAGTVFSALMQSSSAVTGLVIAFSFQGLISLSSGLALVVGANLGTCLTVVLASFQASLTAKRAAVSHVLFNVFGVFLFILFRRSFTKLVALTAASVTRQVANAHTLFNLVNTLILFPLLPLFVRLVTALVPGEDEVIERKPQYLDQRLIQSPAAVIGANQEAVRMGNIALDMLEEALDMFVSGNIKLFDQVQQKEEVVNDLEKVITAYLARANQFAMTEDAARKLTNLMHVVNDLERIGDHAVNITNLALELHERDYNLSSAAAQDLEQMRQAVVRIGREAVSALSNHDFNLAKYIISQDDLVDNLEKENRRNHLDRLTSGLCTPEIGVIFLDVVSNLERVGDHAQNIAEAVADIAFA
ncbi:MAG: Na/Pi cotransporter family protein [Firmicutes bacterium]|nr:Na/Pi cotransporter family protein [Bacillota bacterium]